jgi:TonB family protein
MMNDLQPILLRDRQPESRPRSWAIPASVAAHVLILTVLLRGRSPVFIAPSSVRAGANGMAVTHLYWSGGNAENGLQDGKGTEPKKNSRLLFARKNQVPPRDRATRAAPVAEPSVESEIASAAAAPAAGSPYGSLGEGGSTGSEVRPALPIATVEPVVGAGDLQGIAEGNEVIEITIDEDGNIVARTVIQSLGAAIDAKVLVALENWHFRPATRDGVPIPSRQDVVYHFKPR